MPKHTPATPRSFTICDPDPFSAGSLPSLPHSETTCSINTRWRQNRGNLTGQREREDMPGSVCASVCLRLRPCTYVQPEQSLLLYRGWIARKSAADETKHFLHGEGQRAKLDIKHLTGGQTHSRVLLSSLASPPVLSMFFVPGSYSTGEGYSLPEHFSELFELVVGHLCADGFQPLWHKALPQWLTDDIIRYQTEDPVQALLQLGHCGTGFVPVSSHLGNGGNGLWYMLSAAVMLTAPYIYF